MGASTKMVVCYLTSMDHTIIDAAACVGRLTIADYLVQAGIQVAHAMGVPRPYSFGGQLFATAGLPEDWYAASCEEELIEHLKVALRQRDIDAAGAMAVELLDFPATWAELEFKERTFEAHSDILNLIDAELVDLVNRTLDRQHLDHGTNTWTCYKAILRRAHDRPPEGLRPSGHLLV